MSQKAQKTLGGFHILYSSNSNQFQKTPSILASDHKFTDVSTYSKLLPNQKSAFERKAWGLRI